MKYAVVLEKTDTGFSAYAPDVGGCIATAPRNVKRLSGCARLSNSISKGCGKLGCPFPSRVRMWITSKWRLKIADCRRICDAKSVAIQLAATQLQLQSASGIVETPVSL